MSTFLVALALTGCAPAPVSPTATGSASASATASVEPATAYTSWERLDLPDPAPGVYGGGLPHAVAAFGGGYVAVGTINRSCCADGDPALNSGVVWTSTDGRNWEVHSDLAVFEHAWLRDVIADGSRLLAIGSVAAPIPGEPGISVTAIWSSIDGVIWQQVPGTVPDWVVAGGPGLVGAFLGQAPSTNRPMVTFGWSTDGTAWSVGSPTSAGFVEDLVATPGGGALGVGWTDGPDRSDGSHTRDAIVWTSLDGVSWTGAAVAQHEALFSAATALSAGFVVVGNVEQQQQGGGISYSGAVWLSADGVRWDQREIGVTIEETLSRLFAVRGALIATGDTSRGDLASAMVWVSTDGGVTWWRVANQGAFAGVNNQVADLIGTADGGIMAVGSRWDSATNHPLPQVWLASP